MPLLPTRPAAKTATASPASRSRRSTQVRGVAHSGAQQLRLCRQHRLACCRVLTHTAVGLRAECKYQEGWRPLISINALHQVRGSVCVHAACTLLSGYAIRHNAPSPAHCALTAPSLRKAPALRTQLDMFIFAVAAFHIALSTLTILLAYL
jgi:hypothetical protein